MQPSQLDPNDLEFVIELCQQHSDLIRVRFSSRHSTQKNYIATIQFDNDEEDPIEGWYCTCPTGARVIGCCSHVAALLWYLGVCRAEYDDKGHPLSAQFLLETVEDCIQYAETIDTDDEEEDGVRYSLGSNDSDTNCDLSDD